MSGFRAWGFTVRVFCQEKNPIWNQATPDVNPGALDASDEPIRTFPSMMWLDFEFPGLRLDFGERNHIVRLIYSAEFRIVALQ